MKFFRFFFFVVLATLTVNVSLAQTAAKDSPLRIAVYVDKGARNTGVFRWLELGGKNATILKAFNARGGRTFAWGSAKAALEWCKDIVTFCDSPDAAYLAISPLTSR